MDTTLGRIMPHKKQTKNLLKTILIFLASFTLLGIIVSKYNLSFNQSPSMKGRVFLIAKNSLPQEYKDVVIFKTKEDSFKDVGEDKYPKAHKSKLKEVIGFYGDIIDVKKSIEDRNNHIYINGRDYGIIKEYSLKGERLLPITGIDKRITIPKDYYFVYTPHKDSYDSRYKSVGLIHKSQIIGRAYEIL